MSGKHDSIYIPHLAWIQHMDSTDKHDGSLLLWLQENGENQIKDALHRWNITLFWLRVLKQCRHLTDILWLFLGTIETIFNTI